MAAQQGVVGPAAKRLPLRLPAYTGTQLGAICCLVTNPFLAPPPQAPAPTCPASGDSSGCSAQACFLRKESCLVNLSQGTMEMGPAALGERAWQSHTGPD